MKTWDLDQGPPKTLEELFAFYFDHAKPLYATVQANADLPEEVLWEYTAALDHISQLYTHPEKEAAEVTIRKAYGHLKRASYDVFKLTYESAVLDFRELQRIDTAFIDNGEFKGRMIRHFNNMQSLATRCRILESNRNSEAFPRWKDLYVLVSEFYQEYYLHPAIDWARTVEERLSRKQWWIAFSLGFAASLLASAVFWIVVRLVN